MTSLTVRNPTMVETVRPNRYGPTPKPSENSPSTGEKFAAWAGDYLLPEPAELAAEAVDAPPALTEADAADVLERLHPGRAARAAAEQEKAANPARFGEWAAERFTPSSDTPEAQSLARYLNHSHTI